MNDLSGKGFRFFTRQAPTAALLVSVLIISICAILYELLISTLSSYFLGSSIFHFSLVIGLFLSSMGIGSYLSRYVKGDLIRWFIGFEILLSLIGGLSALLLHAAFAFTSYYYGVMVALIVTLGSLIGLEIPILTRIVRRYENLRDAMAKVLSFDYLGALFASLLFPLLLLPVLGIMRTAFAVGLLNLCVAALNIRLFYPDLLRPGRLMGYAAAVCVLLVAGVLASEKVVSVFDSFLYRDPIVFSRQTPWQQITVTRWNKDTRLYLDGNLQFSSADEHRYHEPLVHVPMLLAPAREQVLLLGGGDGLAVREMLKYADVQQITVVDLDPAITQIASTHSLFTGINQHSLSDPRVKIVNQDAYQFIEKDTLRYDVIVIDLPDPNNTSLGKLYSAEFYRMLSRRMAAGGIAVTQATSPYYARKAYWCIGHTLEEVFPVTVPYGVYVPSFGFWGFHLFVQENGRFPKNPDPQQMKEALLLRCTDVLAARKDSLGLRYLDAEILRAMFHLDSDMAEEPTDINRLDSQRLVTYYEESWNAWK
ncbi:MAG: polyamine aminopropyltransferase [Bacteroidetes bacterium]|nr:MAG: polyamine aminopropyltransferase [Bacteroidota bacterium]